MDGVNRPGAGQQVPAADENEDKENTPSRKPTQTADRFWRAAKRNDS